METATARAIHDPAADFYIDALRKLQDTNIPFLVGGAFAFSHYAHVPRETKDIDVFVKAEDLQSVLGAFEQLGYQTEVPFPHWLGKIRSGDHFMDVIFNSGNGVARVDDFWFEHAVKTNVLGAANVIDAAIDRNVKRVIALSTDKAAGPINLYGATKLCSDKLFTAANSYSGQHKTRFAVVRYGNVIGSRGSVIPFFLKMRSTGVLPITDPRMTRFWITLDQGVDFVLASLERMMGGEIFVPKIPSMNMMDLARALAPDCRIDIVGIRPGEKLHEVMVPAGDGRNTVEFPDHYVILHPFHDWGRDDYLGTRGGIRCAEDFVFASDTNSQWLTPEQLLEMANLQTGISA